MGNRFDVDVFRMNRGLAAIGVSKAVESTIDSVLRGSIGVTGKDNIGVKSVDRPRQCFVDMVGLMELNCL